MTALKQYLPNGLTWMRIALAPLAGLFVLMDAAGAAFAVFVVAALSDYVDGALARAWNTHSAYGAALDPIADKILVLTVLAAFAVKGAFSPLDLAALGLIAAREAGVTALRFALSPTGEALPVSFAAKLKTAVQMAAAGLYLFAGLPAADLLAPVVLPLCLAKAALWTGAALALVSGTEYVAAALARKRD